MVIVLHNRTGHIGRRVLWRRSLRLGKLRGGIVLWGIHLGLRRRHLSFWVGAAAAVAETYKNDAESEGADDCNATHGAADYGPNVGFLVAVWVSAAASRW